MSARNSIIPIRLRPAGRLVATACSAFVLATMCLQSEASAQSQAQLRAHYIERERPECRIADADPKHLFVAAAVSEGDVLSNLQLADPKSTATIVRVPVSKGSQPITVVLQASSPVIWDFEGAVERVQRVIVFSGRVPSAVHNVPHQRVEFPKLQQCPFHSIPSQAQEAEKMLFLVFGRLPNQIEITEQLGWIALPTLQYAFSIPAENPEQTRGEQDLAHFFPGGFRTLDPKGVVAAVEVLAPETYPSAAGLIQLEKAGAIRSPTHDERRQFANSMGKRFQTKSFPDFQYHRDFDYVVTRDALLPAGLYGAHSRNFLVLAGVPAPRGSSGHGCLAFIDGARFAEGNSCYVSSDSSAVQRLEKLPPIEATMPCRQLSPPPGTSVQAVSLYATGKAERGKHNFRLPSAVEVKVAKPGPVLLVLSMYDPAIWRISTSSETQIVGVILTGYSAGAVEGITDTTVVDLSGPQAKRQYANAACSQFDFWEGPHFHGGPKAVALDRQIHALTGMEVDRVQGRTETDHIEIR